MKKRVLSMLLAFALCFTAFAGFAAEEGPADGGRIETNVDRLDNVLTKLATPGQQDKVKGIAPVTVDPAKEPWSTIIEKVLNPTVLETNLDVDIKELTVRPYYFLRHLEERVGGDPEFSAEEYPLISELVAAFDKANTENRVDNIGFRAAINSFNTYKDAIKTALNDFVDSDEAQGELLVYTHVIDSVIPDDVLKPDVTPEDAKAVYEEALDMLRRGELKDLQAVLDYVKEQILDPDAEITPEQEQQNSVRIRLRKSLLRYSRCLLTRLSPAPPMPIMSSARPKVIFSTLTGR